MNYQHHLAARIYAIFLLPGMVSIAAAQSSHSWNTFEVDFNALGLASISPNSNHHRSPEAGAMERVATYDVAFSKADSYNLYVRWIPGSFYVNNSFGDTPEWRDVRNIEGAAGEYVWTNLSEALGNERSGNHTYEVKAPGRETFMIAARTRDTRIDAFVFGQADKSFTVAQLDAAAQNHPAAEAAGLFGVQAEAASAFGKEPVPEAARLMQIAFANRLNVLTQEIRSVLPTWDDAKVAAWLAAIEAEEGPAKEAADTARVVANLQGAEARLRELKENQKYGPKTIEDAMADLERARAQGEDLENAKNFLAHRKRDLERLESNIQRAKATVEKARTDLPAAIRAADAARQAHEDAMATTWQAMDALGMSEILGTTALDTRLAEAMVIANANPRDLAKFAQESPENQSLLQQLLENNELMIQMLVADGPTGGKYGEAMKIYTDIQKASDKAKDGVFQRLALAVSLAHAEPIYQRETTGGDSGEGEEEASDGSIDNKIDPVKRYLSYEKWYLDGELDQGFKDLSAWNMAMAVNAHDPDEILAWGRQMLHNLRPDCIPDNGDTSIYIDVVDNEIRYGSGDVPYDRPELAFMQNILANGGICGRRAFFGRFTLQAFGVPTAARVEPGHATLGHWHPKGWATRLGGTFNPGEDWRAGGRGFYARMNDSRTRPYGADVNFQASSKAREDAVAFMRVKRAQWIGELVGEERKPGLITWSGRSRGPDPSESEAVGNSIFWNELALHEQRRINAAIDSRNRESSGTAPVAATEPTATGTITIDDKGVITIPAAATSSPTESSRAFYRGRQTDLVVFLNNKSGDTVLHVSRYSKETDSFEYTFDVPRAGNYQLVASVVTPRWDERLLATANGGNPIEMALPYTIGMWDKSDPIEIALKAGRNVLKFQGPARATLSEFTLTPIR